MMLLFRFTRLRHERGGKKGPRLLCLAYLHVFTGGMEQNRAGNSVIWLREKCVVCLSLELQQIECTLMHDVNDLTF